VTNPVISIVRAGATKQRKRQSPKGRPVLPEAAAQVVELVGGAPYRHDLLIEYLHQINDRYRQLSAPHLAALARLLGLAQTEVYEVATFYHHFDVVKENPDGTVPTPAALTVRVCDGLSCEMAGARDLLAKLPSLLGREVRVIPAPCIGRCEQAPAVVVHQNPVPHATIESVQAVVRSGIEHDSPKNFMDFDDYVASG
jgi:NADH:ubiquinone oxidoreductase subunit E